jgi:hypothetical protein
MRNGPNTPFASFASLELASAPGAGLDGLAPVLGALGDVSAAALVGSAGAGCCARFTGLDAGAGAGSGSNAALPVFGVASGAFGAGVGAAGGSLGAGASGGPGAAGAGLGSANGGGASGGLVGTVGGVPGPGGASCAQAARAASTSTKAGNQATGEVAFIAKRNRPRLGGKP